MVKVKINSNKEWGERTVADVLALFDDPKAQSTLNLYSFCNNSHVIAKAVFSCAGKTIENSTEQHVELDVINQEKRLIKKVTYLAMEEFFAKRPSAWGILTGIRPTKIVHRLMDLGEEQEQICNFLREEYLVTTEKAQLLTHIASVQRELIFSYRDQKKVGVYIGIPFCPTRCSYCSFPGYELKRNIHLKEPFCDALQREIIELGKAILDAGFAVQHIYIGGGTPTSLDPMSLEKVMRCIQDNLVTKTTEEFTVEAGRPDTIDEIKLEILKSAGVNRISVNPQTLNEKTLKLINRDHTVADFFYAYELVKKMNIDNVNVDLIAGLPGEGVKEVETTLHKLNQIEFENLTVHPLAFKRGSELVMGGQDKATANNRGTAEEIIKMTRDFAEGQLKMHPYYLYRQKKIFGNMENVGYSVQGRECIYNIQVMEERQTIVGMGVGAGSKFVNSIDWTLINKYNPKDISTYINKLDQLITEKVDKLRQMG
ncbi:oxygen-independent coproporphyrinogen-3 oxidase [Desulfitispora alkaliphila]|uniref:coproporphyrinogen dehydrogenase HemZ n=1 Tax=Desulfitispora alkaliphila TaxID=622674 RepID=UPI003D1C2CAC